MPPHHTHHCLPLCVTYSVSDLCLCDAGFTGRHCNEDIDECEINATVCLNGASCNNTHGSFLCACAAGYIGRYCSLYNKCHTDNSYCNLHGNCSVRVSDNDVAEYSCSCYGGWVGSRCQEAVVGRYFHLLICEDTKTCSNSN